MLVISKDTTVCNNTEVLGSKDFTDGSDHMPLNGVCSSLTTCNYQISNCIRCISVTPCSVGLLWLHDVITCLSPPHAHSEMPTSVSSTHSNTIQDKNLFMRVHV